MEKSKVYFTKNITPEMVVKMFQVLNKDLKGKVAVKLHSGEKGNQNYVRPEFVKPVIDYVKGTVVECNTAYEGARNYTDKHIELLKEHGWSKYFKVDILDAEKPDLVLDIPKGEVIKKNYVGKGLEKYNSMLVLSHFKGHPMGGYGGAIKQLSIGCASTEGKCYIHSAGITLDQSEVWNKTAKQEDFLKAMAESAGSVVEYFKGEIAYINIMCNMSVDCDCCAKAEVPCMKDIGILSSLDPVALDKACIDLVYNSSDSGKKHLIKRIESRKGLITIDEAEKQGYGTKNYELINIDN